MTKVALSISLFLVDFLLLLFFFFFVLRDIKARQNFYVHFTVLCPLKNKLYIYFFFLTWYKDMTKYCVHFTVPCYIAPNPPSSSQLPPWLKTACTFFSGQSVLKWHPSKYVRHALLATCHLAKGKKTKCNRGSNWMSRWKIVFCFLFTGSMFHQCIIAALVLVC